MEKINIPTTCPQCNKITNVEMTIDQHYKWVNNIGHIQHIFPEKSMDERELLISGICGECWKNIFGNE
jgi:hypothetical protein